MPPTLDTSTDPKTGETIKRCDIPKTFTDEIDKVLQAQQGILNQFMFLSQQIATQQNQWLELRKKIDLEDKKIKEKLQFVCRKLKLADNDPWTYNMQSKKFELREPPPLKPLTASQLPEPEVQNV